MSTNDFVTSTRARDRVVRIWPMFACGVLGGAARADLLALPMAKVEWVLAAASTSAALVLIDAWARDASDIRGGGMQAFVAATWCAFCAMVGSW